MKENLLIIAYSQKNLNKFIHCYDRYKKKYNIVLATNNRDFLNILEEKYNNLSTFFIDEDITIFDVSSEVNKIRKEINYILSSCIDKKQL